MRPRVLDLCCCQGGASKGYVLAGFDATGVDLDRQPHYPYEFHQADALKYLAAHGGEYDAIHASFPCQAFTKAQRIQKNIHPDLITPGRELLEATGKPWVMENVPGSPLQDHVELCGCMFPGLNVYRERWFETGGGFSLTQPEHPAHTQRQTKMGRRLQPGTRMIVVGNFTGAEDARKAMDIEWMTRDGLREAIPPAYTQWVGERLMGHVMATRSQSQEDAA